MIKARSLLCCSVTGTLLAVSPAIAVASYSPTLSVTLHPPTAATAPAITSTLTSEPGDTPSKTIRIHYPPQFDFNPDFGVSGCPPAAEKSDRCPADSQIGTAEAETVLGEFSGPVYFTPDYRVLIYLRGPGGLLQSKFVGYFQDAPDGGVDAILDSLPDFPSSSSSITIDGGSKSTLLTPAACGSYPIVGHFTSHNGEQATSTANVQITGCDTQPSIDRAWLTRTKLSQAQARHGASDTLHWDLSDNGARTVVSLQRLKTVRGMQIRHTVWRRQGSATRGTNSLTFRATASGRPLAAGQYRLTIAVFSISGHPSDLISLALYITGRGPAKSPSGCIRQGAGAGDNDSDNHGGPSDGDGCI